MSNDSSTGGYLSPTSVNGDLNDAALTDFFQGVVVGITGIAGALVRPRWQPDPPNLPDADGVPVTWAAIGVVGREPDAYAFVRHASAAADNSTPAFDTEYTNEIIEVLLSFYGPAAETMATTFARGLKIAQNREAMFLQGYALVNSDRPRNAPEQINNRWVYRTDISFRVRHVEQYEYPVLDLAEVQSSVNNDAPHAQVKQPAGFGAEPFGETPFGT